MFSFKSLSSVTSALTICTVIHLLMGLFTLAISITATIDTEIMHSAVFRYSIPSHYTISSLSITSFFLGLCILWLKPRQRQIVDVFQVVNAVTASVVVLNIAFKLNEIVSLAGLTDVLGNDYGRFWTWWCFVFGSGIVVGVAACLNVLGARAYIELHFMDTHSFAEFQNYGVHTLKCTSVAQIAAGLTLFSISAFGFIQKHVKRLDEEELVLGTELLWYSASLEILIAVLTIISAAKCRSLIKASPLTRRQFDVLSTINLVICVIVVLKLALTTVTALIISIGFRYDINMPTLWHYYTVNGMAALVVAVVILALSVKTAKMSMGAAKWIAPMEIE